MPVTDRATALPGTERLLKRRQTPGPEEARAEPVPPREADGGRSPAGSGPGRPPPPPHRRQPPQLHGAPADSRVTCAGRNPGEGVSLPGKGAAGGGAAADEG